MRAYMSLPGVRAVCCVSPIRDGQHAETEARMLLGETEHTELGGMLSVDADMLAAFHANTGDPAGPALAEALAAFCDDGQESRS